MDKEQKIFMHTSDPAAARVRAVAWRIEAHHIYIDMKELVALLCYHDQWTKAAVVIKVMAAWKDRLEIDTTALPALKDVRQEDLEVNCSAKVEREQQISTICILNGIEYVIKSHRGTKLLPLIEQTLLQGGHVLDDLAEWTAQDELGRIWDMADPIFEDGLKFWINLPPGTGG